MLKLTKSATVTKEFADTSTDFTDEHFFTIDSIGLYHYKKFLSLDEVGYINELLDRWIAQAEIPPSKFPFFTLDPIFADIMSRKWIVEACKRTIGPQYRLDHCVGIQQPGKIKSAKTGQWVDQGYHLGNIHGGQHQSQGSVYYHSYGKNAFSGHMTFGISLIGQRAEEGGFCYIPGTQNTKVAENGSTTFKDMLKQNYDSQCIVVPNLEPGDVVFFPENMLHGMKPMKIGTSK